MGKNQIQTYTNTIKEEAKFLSKERYLIEENNSHKTHLSLINNYSIGDLSLFKSDPIHYH